MSAFYQIAPLFGFGLNIILAIAVLRNHLHSRSHQSFTLFLASMGLWALTIFWMRNSSTLAEALPWEKATFAILPFVSVSYYHFVIHFTRTNSRAWEIPLAYLGAVVFSILAASTDLIIADMRQMWYGPGFVGGPLIIPFTIIFYGFVIAALIMVIRTGRKTSSLTEKTRYYYVAAGASLTLIGLFIDILAARGLRVYPMGIPSNILFSAVCTYAILKYHLLDIQVVIRKGTAYVLVSALGTGIYIGLLFIAYTFITHAWSLPFWMNMGFIVVIAVGLQPTLGWSQNLVDKWFYRGRYDYLQALEKLGEETKNSIDLAFIAGSLVDTVASAMRCGNITLLLPDAEDKNFVSVARRGDKTDNAVRIRRESAIVWWLQRSGDFLVWQDITVIPQLQALTSNEKVMLNSLNAEIFIPVITMEGLRGVLILGRKLSQQDYSPEELSMLRVVTRQMATTLDNARLYDLQLKGYREQALLARLGMIVSSELDVNKICDKFLKELNEIVPVDYAGIISRETAGNGPAAVSTWTTVPALRGWDPGSALPPKEITTSHAITDPSQSSHYDERLRKAGIRSLLLLPMHSKEELIGYAVFASRKPDAYFGDNLRLLQQIVIQLAIAVEKANLYKLEQEAREELERQYKERTEFINSLIHEVKTPITGMLASSELLREELNGDTTPLKELAENLDVAARNLDRRISELVNFVRLQNTETVLRVRKSDFREIAKTAVSQVAGLLRNRDQKLEMDLSASSGYVTADPERIVQVLLNLFTNASKFSDAHETISLRAFPEGDYLIVELRDGAPVLKAEERKLIFSPYNRNRYKSSGGLGLGLSICKKLVEMHGGKIWVESGDRGNIFKFSLPLAREAHKEKVRT